MTTSSEPVSAKTIDAAIRAIRDYHAIGRRSIAKTPGKSAYGDGKIAAEAKRFLRSETFLRKARQFAAAKTGYSPERLEHLFRLLRRHRPSFGISHIGILVTLSWADGRADLQRRAIQGHWSKTELEAEIRLQFGHRRHGGRRRRVAADPAQALVQLDETSDTWHRWVMAAKNVTVPDGRPLVDTLPADVVAAILRIDGSIARLRDMIAAELQKVRETPSPTSP